MGWVGIVLVCIWCVLFGCWVVDVDGFVYC